MLSSSSSLTTVSKLLLVIGHRVVPIGTSPLWLLHVRTPHSSASVHLPLLFGTRSGIMAAFCLHIIRVKALCQVVQSLLQKGAFELAPLSSLGYYSRLFFDHEGFGVVAASIKYLNFVPKSDRRWRRRRFFILSVEDSVLERRAALEFPCFGIGFGRLELNFNYTFVILLC